MPEEFQVGRIVEVRTFALRSEPGVVVLRVTTASGAIYHFETTAAELAILAQQMFKDAMLIGREAAGNA